MGFKSLSSYQIQGITFVLLGPVLTFDLNLEIPTLSSEEGITKSEMLKTNG